MTSHFRCLHCYTPNFCQIFSRFQKIENRTILCTSNFCSPLIFRQIVLSLVLDGDLPRSFSRNISTILHSNEAFSASIFTENSSRLLSENMNLEMEKTNTPNLFKICQSKDFQTFARHLAMETFHDSVHEIIRPFSRNILSERSFSRNISIILNSNGDFSASIFTEIVLTFM